MKRLRKQIYDLKLEDLEKYPVWEFALDEEGKHGQDEATVRPFVEEPPVDPAGGMYIVRCDFRLADGTHAIGYLTPQIPALAHVGYVQPTIVTTKGQLNLWCGWERPTDDAIARAYRLLGKGSVDVFPIHYESTVELTAGPVSGAIAGFVYRRSFDDPTVIEVL